MKTYIRLLALSFSFLLNSRAATTNITWTWDAAANATGYRFYDVTGGGRVLLGGTPGITFTVSNMVVGAPRVFCVCGTNMWLPSVGEGPDAIPYPVPALATNAPGNLRPTTFSFDVTVPAVLELSTDLADWNDRLRVRSATATNAQIEVVQSPRLPMLFARVKSQVAAPVPPVP